MSRDVLKHLEVYGVDYSFAIGVQRYLFMSRQGHLEVSCQNT